MNHTAEQYRDQMIAAQPPGIALPTDPSSDWALLLLALGDEFARVESRAISLLEESDPRATYELLADWERLVGLPDTCVTGELSTEQRVNSVVARLARGQGISLPRLLTAAELLGYTITITEFLPHSVDADVDEAIFGQDWVFAIQVNTAGNAITDHTVDSTVDDSLTWWGNERLECAIRRIKPGGRVVLFNYD